MCQAIDANLRAAGWQVQDPAGADLQAGRGASILKGASEGRLVGGDLGSHEAARTVSASRS